MISTGDCYGSSEYCANTWKKDSPVDYIAV